MTNFALFHLFTARDGESRYYQALGRFQCEVLHDQKRYVYDLHHMATSYRAGATVKGKREFRAFVKRHWIDDHNGDARQLSGRWPSYHID